MISGDKVGLANSVDRYLCHTKGGALSRSKCSMLDKLHPSLAYSLGVAISALLFAARCVSSGPRRRSVVGVIVLAGVFWESLTPFVMCWALATLEMQCPVEAIENAVLVEFLISHREP